MIQVWKCEYCDVIGSMEEIQLHEAEECFHNPIHKFCYTCDNFRKERRNGDEWDECLIKTEKEMDDIIFGVEICNDWKNDKLRIDKLSKLKDIINNEESMEV